jgi:flagellar biosynthesis component FlhA
MGADSVVAMLGVVLLVLAFLVGIPIFLMTMGGVGALLGMSLKDDAEQRYEGSELVELNR